MGHHANLSSSERLQLVYRLLSDGAERSTYELSRLADVCAVNSIVSELRANGAVIECRQSAAPHGERIWLYRMVSPARGHHPPHQTNGASR